MRGSEKNACAEVNGSNFVGYLGMNTQILYKNLIEAGLE